MRLLCQKEGIVFQAYASLGSGQLGLCQNPVVMEVSSKVGMSPGQVLLRWAVQVNFSPRLLFYQIEPLKKEDNVIYNQFSLAGARTR